MVARFVSVFLTVVMTVFLFLPSAAWAADLANGAKVFSANCAACHIGGGNLVNPAKTLKKSDLEKYEMASIEAVVTQITNGKNGMPAFKGRLTDEQIEDVANYVLEQAGKDWT